MFHAGPYAGLLQFQDKMLNTHFSMIQKAKEDDYRCVHLMVCYVYRTVHQIRYGWRCNEITMHLCVWAYIACVCMFFCICLCTVSICGRLMKMTRAMMWSWPSLRIHGANDFFLDHFQTNSILFELLLIHITVVFSILLSWNDLYFLHMFYLSKRFSCLQICQWQARKRNHDD